jgi:8-oxo-dGTP pyrophosphatase MutT (NUDIX family)
MHTEWSCFALITMEGNVSGDILIYSESTDSIACGQWRLPGGPRAGTEKEPMATLARALQSQTGIDIRRKSHVPLVDTRNEVIARYSSKRRKRSRSNRYYLVTITADEFIDKVWSGLRENQHLQWVTLEHALSSDFFPRHREVLDTYAKTRRM